MTAPVWRRRCAYLPAESQWWADTVAEHFDTCDEQCLVALGFTAAVMDWQVARLSTGERQRLALARLLANRPQALLLDEPTASLDPDNAGRVEQLIGRYRREHGAPVIWVSHDSRQIARVCTRACRMADGGLVEDDRA